MSSFLFVTDDENLKKINIDDLYEKKRTYDLSKLNLFNKILNRIHVRIKTTSRQKIDEQFCWFVVPEIIIGVPKYDQGSCIAYLIDKLKDNGFNVRYIHPNTLFISWIHWVPAYVRAEIKNKTGIVINEFGEKTFEKNEEMEKITYTNKITNEFSNTKEPNQIVLKPSLKKSYTPINSYKPSGNLIYSDDILSKIEDKFI